LLIGGGGLIGHTRATNGVVPMTTMVNLQLRGDIRIGG
jgi:hypothetical protein